ncbi:Crotonase core [Macrophomina phaseolina MS6]|uniref:Crotonase core n=1 Tax=Macrophomina phaseolina (strain MS6) TaxID=1126212 RepID=K2SEI6_MACPH|nr:Crotonase core [Macrophomina phaseolina MS6]
MQFTTTLAVLASAAGALALPSGPVATTPTPTLLVQGLTWNVTDGNLAVSFNIQDSVEDQPTHCESSSTNIHEKFVCDANKNIEFQFDASELFDFTWFEVFWTFPAGVLTNDGKAYLADGVNSLPDPKCTQGCVVQELSMQGRTTVVSN